MKKATIWEFLCVSQTPIALLELAHLRTFTGRKFSWVIKTPYFSQIEAELADIIPVVPCSIAGGRIIGRLTAGNRHGLLVPDFTTDQVEHY